MKIFISYDNRPDDQLLIDYGFCLPPGENPDSFLDLAVEEILPAALKLFEAENIEISEEFRRFTTASLQESKQLRIFENNIEYEVDFFVKTMVKSQFQNDLTVEIEEKFTKKVLKWFAT